MKILFFVHGFPPHDRGGTETYTQSVANELTVRGHHVVVVHGAQEAADVPTVEPWESDGLSGFRVIKSGLFVDAWDRSHAPEVKALVQQILLDEKPDLVHVHHWIRLTRNLVECCRRLGIPVVATLHDTWTSCPRAFRVRDGAFCDRPVSAKSCLDCVPRQFLVADDAVATEIDLFRDDAREELRLAHRVVVPSRSVWETIQAGLDLDGVEPVVLPHGTIAEEGLVPAVNSSDGIVRIGTWGQLSVVKGTDLILDAVKGLQDLTSERFEVHIWGTSSDEEYVTELMGMAEDLPVTWHGAFSPSDLHGAALDLAVFPSRASESWSFVVDEALRLKLPVLVPDRGAPCDRVGDHGWVFEAESVEHLTETLLRIVERRSPWPVIESVSLPTLSDHMETLINLYQDVVAEPPPGQSPDRQLQLRHQYQMGLRVQSLEDALRQSVGLNEKLIDQIDGLKGVLKEAEGAAAGHGELREDLLGEVKAVRAELQAITDQYLTLQDDRDQIQAELQKLGQARDEAVKNLLAIQERAREASAEAMKSWNAVRDANLAIQVLETESNSQRETFAELAADKAALLDQLKSQQGLSERAEALRLETESSIQALKDELEVAQRERAALEHDRESVTAKRREAEQLMAHAQLLLRANEQEAVRLKGSFGDLAVAMGVSGDGLSSGEFMGEVSRRSQECRRLLSELNGTTEGLTQECRLLQDERDRLESLVKTFEAERRQRQEHRLVRAAERLAGMASESPRNGLKILMVIHDFLPHHAAGSQVYTYRLAHALRLRGHDVRVLTTEAHPGVHSYFLRETSYEGVPIYEVSHQHHTEYFERTYKDPNMERIFEGLLDRLKPDIVHIQHLHNHSSGYVPRAKARNIPVFYTLHEYMLLCPRGGQMLREGMQVCDQPVPDVCAACITHLRLGPARPDEGRAPLSSRLARHLPSDFKERLKEVLPTVDQQDGPGETQRSDHGLSAGSAAISKRLEEIKSAVSGVDLFLSPSSFLRQKFIDCGMVEPERIIHSDNGQDRSPFENIVRTSSDSLRVGYIGTIADFKGVDVLVEALNGLAHIPTIEGHIHGGLGTFAAFSEELMGRASNPRITFHDRYAPEKVGEILGSLDVLVVPSRWYENAPLTIQEAYMAGIPVVASRLGGMAEWVEEDVTGLTFEVGNAQDLAAKLQRLHDDRELLRRLASARINIKSIEQDARSMEARYLALVSNETQQGEAGA